MIINLYILKIINFIKYVCVCVSKLLSKKYVIKT